MGEGGLIELVVYWSLGQSLYWSGEEEGAYHSDRLICLLLVYYLFCRQLCVVTQFSLYSTARQAKRWKSQTIGKPPIRCI